MLGLVGVPKKNRLFYTYGPGESYLIENGQTKKINCSKKQPKGKIVALSSVLKPSDIILNKLKEYHVNSIVKMASSYKFCVIATGEYDIYAARERANEWDYAAGHAVAQNAGAIIKTLDEKIFFCPLMPTFFNIICFSNLLKSLKLKFIIFEKSFN